MFTTIKRALGFGLTADEKEAKKAEKARRRRMKQSKKEERRRRRVVKDRAMTENVYEYFGGYAGWSI